MQPHAVFLLAGVAPGKLAAVTRGDGSLGLPGGKVDPGESPGVALRRESAEEGWALSASAQLDLVHLAEVDERLVAWYATDTPPTKAAPRQADALRGIGPVVVDRDDPRLDSLGNREAIDRGSVSYAALRRMSATLAVEGLRHRQLVAARRRNKAAGRDWYAAAPEQDAYTDASIAAAAAYNTYLSVDPTLMQCGCGIYRLAERVGQYECEHCGSHGL